jgi:hypothetical protein
VFHDARILMSDQELASFVRPGDLLGLGRQKRSIDAAEHLKEIHEAIRNGNSPGLKEAYEEAILAALHEVVRNADRQAKFLE